MIYRNLSRTKKRPRRGQIGWAGVGAKAGRGKEPGAEVARGAEAEATTVGEVAVEIGTANRETPEASAVKETVRDEETEAVAMSGGAAEVGIGNGRTGTTVISMVAELMSGQITGAELMSGQITAWAGVTISMQGDQENKGTTTTLPPAGELSRSRKRQDTILQLEVALFIRRPTTFRHKFQHSCPPPLICLYRRPVLHHHRPRIMAGREPR